MDWWLAAFTAIGGAVGSLVTWIFGIRKQKAEVTGQEYENFTKFVAANRLFIADMKEQLADLMKQNRELREKVSTLEDEVVKLKEQFPCENCPSPR